MKITAMNQFFMSKEKEVRWEHSICLQRKLHSMEN